MHPQRFMHSSKKRALRPLRAVWSRMVQTTLQGQLRNPSMDPSSAYALYFMPSWKTVSLVFKNLVFNAKFFIVHLYVSNIIKYYGNVI